LDEYKELEQYIDLRGKTKVEDRRGNLQDDKDN
jgi:hypothetical protein